MTTELQFQMFMAHIQHKDKDFLLEQLNKYDIGKYLIGMETSDKGVEHFHFLVEMHPTDYHNYAQNIFKKHYKLRDQARDGKARQYGKMTKIKDLEKAKSYTVKDNNVITNFDEAELKEIKDRSFKKIQKFDLAQEVYKHLDTIITPNYFVGENKLDAYETYDRIKIQIIKFYIKKDIKLSPQYKSMIINYVRKSEQFTLSIKLNFLKHIIN